MIVLFKKILELASVVILVLGILPSCTSLSQGVVGSFSWLARYSGPLNPLKLGLPVLLLFLFSKRGLFARKFWIYASVVLAVGSLATVIAAWRCGFPPPVLREWSVIVLGFVAAASLFALGQAWRSFVIASWVLLVYGTVLLEFVYPQMIDLLYLAVFDPSTVMADFDDIKGRALTGVFGRQSMAKLLTWMPWIAAIAVAAAWPGMKRRVLWGAATGALVVFSSAVVLATTQRSALVSSILAICFFVAHQAYVLRRRRMIIGGAVCLVAVVAAMFIVVPPAVYKPRLKSLFGIENTDNYSKKFFLLREMNPVPGERKPGNVLGFAGRFVAQKKWQQKYENYFEFNTPFYFTPQTNADINKNLRIKMAVFSLKVIAANPLGRPCISMDEFLEAGIHVPSHAHNMFLEQLRTRGWLWGLIHLALWAMAFFGAWRERSGYGSVLVAGIASVLSGGMFDHPWFVLNHSVVLWFFLLSGAFLAARQRRISLLFQEK